MSVFASQFSRARPYTTAYVGEDTGTRFWTPDAVTAAAIAGAGALVVAAAVDAAVDGPGEGGATAGADPVPDGIGALEALAGAPGAIDPAALDDATLALPGALVETPLPGAVAIDDAGGGSMLDAYPGIHTSSSVGGVDVTAADAALLDDGGSSAWSHYFEADNTHVGGDGQDFSYVMTDSGTVYSDGGGVSYDGPLMGF